MPADTQISQPTAASLSPVNDDLVEALEEARKKVRSLLQHPDDLMTSKFESVRRRFLAEKSSVDSILKISVQGQLNDIHDGLSMARDASKERESALTNLKLVEELCAKSERAMVNYPSIRNLAIAHQNFMRTHVIAERLQKLNDDVARVGKLLEQDSKNILSDAPNLLYIHQQLFQLEDFKDRSLANIRSESSAVVHILTRYFRKLDQLSEAFKSYLWDLTRHLIDLVRENQGSVIVRLLKIIEVEEMYDERALSTQEQSLSVATIGAKPNVPSSNTTSVPIRTIKNYRSQFFEHVLSTIKKTFEEKFSSSLTLEATLQTAEFVFEDLSIVFEELAPRFPTKYKIFPFFVLQYHKHVYDILNNVVTTHLDTKDILMVTSWVRDYYKRMNDRLGVTEELLEPRLLDDKEGNLIGEYVKLIKNKMKEWVDRLQQTEEQEFLSRQNAPDTDADGYYSTSSVVIFFQMINQQVDIAVETKGSRLLLDVTAECVNVMLDFQARQSKMIHDEFDRFKQRNDSFPLGFPEYVIAICNNHMRCTEFLESLEKRIVAAAEADKGTQQFTDLIRKALDGFTTVGKNGIKILADVVYSDVSSALTSFFTPQWYDQPQLMGSVILTLKDYFSDFQPRLHNYLFTKFTNECMDQFLSAYLDTFKSKSAKFKIPVAVDQAKADLNSAIEFWCEYRPSKRVKQSFDLFEKIIGLLEASPSLLFLSWYSLWKVYSDVPLTFVEDLFSKRSDLEKSVVKEAIANCKTKIKETPAGELSQVKSLFSAETVNST